MKLPGNIFQLSCPFGKNKWGNLRKYTIPAGTPGSGVGKGGGAGGTVRESGGGLGKFGAAQEERYFHDKEKETLQKVKEELKKLQEIQELSKK